LFSVEKPRQVLPSIFILSKLAIPKTVNLFQ
jgi:hypothetical protein